MRNCNLTCRRKHQWEVFGKHPTHFLGPPFQSMHPCGLHKVDTMLQNEALHVLRVRTAIRTVASLVCVVACAMT